VALLGVLIADTLLISRHEATPLAHASATFPAAAGSDAVTVGFGQTFYSGQIGVDFTVDILVTDASLLDGWQAVLVFDPSIIQIEAITSGGFLSSAGRAEAALGLAVEEPGRVVIGGYTVGSAPAASGSGLLARLTLRGVATGSTTLNLADVVFTSLTGQGQVTVQSPAVSGATIEITTPLAVALAYFEGAPQSNGVMLSWETVSETDVQGFSLRRDVSPIGAGALLALIPSQTPGSAQGSVYQWLDASATVGETYYYWLEVIALSGATTSYGPLIVDYQAPTVVTVRDLATSSGEGLALAFWGAMVLVVVPLIRWLRQASPDR
jgi:hypothetical protein